MSLSFLKPTKELTSRQKKVLKGFQIRKHREFKDENGYQQKRINFWCAVENDNYQATDRHQHCKLCYVKKYGDLHPIIKI